MLIRPSTSKSVVPEVVSMDGAECHIHYSNKGWSDLRTCMYFLIKCLADKFTELYRSYDEDHRPRPRADMGNMRILIVDKTTFHNHNAFDAAALAMCYYVHHLQGYSSVHGNPNVCTDGRSSECVTVMPFLRDFVLSTEL